ncbi:ABC transporter ATP-binding protein [Rhodococcus sp. 5G237]
MIDQTAALADAPVEVPRTGHKAGETAGNAHIRISGLTKKYGDKVAVNNIDLDVRAGEFLVLLGPSGCGKTTTMRSIAGLEHPTSGSISIGGRTVFDARTHTQVAPNERNIGMVFQSYAIWPHRTVFQNVAFPLTMKRPRPSKEAIEKRVEATLEMVGLDHVSAQSASRLSGGQMQRVALARSVVMEPDVLLLDEPLSNLDAKLREKLRVELKQIQRDLGMTSIYVTHDQAEALALADRIVLMRNGTIEQQGTPMELYHDPQTRFAAEFIGLNNKLIGRATQTGDGARFDVPGSFDLFSGSALSTTGPATAFIRAEDIRIVLGGPEYYDGTNLLQGTVELVELLGSQFLYAVRVGETLLQVLTGNNGQMLAHGTEVQLAVDVRHVRCFPEEQS